MSEAVARQCLSGPRRRLRAKALGCVLGWILAGSLVTGSSAQAETATARARPSPRTAPFWQAAHDPDKLRADALVRQARALLYPALGRASLLGSLGQAKRVAIDAALARLSLAQRMDPGNPEALYLEGMGLAQWEARDASGQVRRRDREAIAALNKLQTLAPDYAPFEIAFELAILYTRVERFDLARKAWQHALAVQLGEPSVPTVYSNLAEVTMMAGDLPAAATLYERAVELGDGESRLLPMWGLAVVLDRLGESRAALRWAQRAIEEDQRPMGVLRAPGVFFVPAYEVHYYMALGQMAEATRARGRVLDRCEKPLPRTPALEGADRATLQSLIRLAGQLRGLAPELNLEPLRDAAQARLSERNRLARRQGATTVPPSREAQAFVGALAALRDFHRYLDEGGMQGPFGQTATARTEALRACLGIPLAAPKR